MPSNRSKYAEEIGAAVRAELSRRGRSIASLVPVLGISRNTIYRRTRGQEPFDYTQLQLIAEDLGVDIRVLIESARVGDAA